jgi:tetratricopeptide (TPR) repeat protein
MSQRSLEKKKLRARKRQRRKARQDEQASRVVPVSGNVNPEVIQNLIEDEDFESAEMLLDQEVLRHAFPNSTLLRMQVCLYTISNQHAKCVLAALQLLDLEPQLSEEQLILIKRADLCGWTAIALKHGETFLKNSPHSWDARQVAYRIRIWKKQCDLRACELGIANSLSAEQQMEVLQAQDEISMYLAAREFEKAFKKSQELLTIIPNCSLLRDQLAHALFHLGRLSDAISLARESLSRDPNDPFAPAMLGRLLLLSGEVAESHQLADRIASTPSRNSQAITNELIFLSMLGRDQAVAQIGMARKLNEVARYSHGLFFHLIAVAQYRIGQEKRACVNWRKCAKADFPCDEGEGILEDIESGCGHAAWVTSIENWIPETLLTSKIKKLDKQKKILLTRDFPEIVPLLPFLLERGDPNGRGLAFSLLRRDPNAYLDLLMNFATDKWGPDAMRYEALCLLKSCEKISFGPHRFFIAGKASQIHLPQYEVTHDAIVPSSPQQAKLSEKGLAAFKAHNFDLAAELFEKILEQHPDDYQTQYDLCAVWAMRDGTSGKKRYLAKCQELHDKYPEYSFAAIALAQVAVFKRDPHRALQLIEPVQKNRRLHVTEAIALCRTEVEIAMFQRQREAAELAYLKLLQYVDQCSDEMVELRESIDRRFARSLWGRLFGSSSRAPAVEST